MKWPKKKKYSIHSFFIALFLSSKFLETTCYLNEDVEREWSIGKVTAIQNRVYSIAIWISEDWISVPSSAVDGEILRAETALPNDDSPEKNTKKVLLKELRDVETLRRRLEALKALQKALNEGRYSDAKGKFYHPSQFQETKQVCMSNVVEELCIEDQPYIICDEDDIARFDSLGSGLWTSLTAQNGVPAPQRIKELMFFDSRWLWDPQWPTIVTNHSAFFSWSGFETILRFKPEETRNTFVAEAAFCCQVPLHCIIDTHFSATSDELVASFKVVHHPSVEPAEIDVRISQHPFWSMTHLRDSLVEERKGLDRISLLFRDILGLSENNNGMYFSQFLETLPKTNFVSERDAYEGEIMEALSLCDRLRFNNDKLRVSMETYRNEFLLSQQALKKNGLLSQGLQSKVDILEEEVNKLRSSNEEVALKLRAKEDELESAEKNVIHLKEEVGVLTGTAERASEEKKKMTDVLRSITGCSENDSQEGLLERLKSMKAQIDLAEARNATAAEEHHKQLIALEAQMSHTAHCEQKQLATELEKKSKEIEQLKSEIQEILADHEEDMKEWEKDMAEKSFEISDLLEKVEEMTLMVQEARQGEEQALRLRMQSDTEVFRLQTAIDNTKDYPAHNEHFLSTQKNIESINNLLSGLRGLMNIQTFQSILSACEQALSDTKSGNEKNLLFSATNNLKYSLHVARSKASKCDAKKGRTQDTEEKKDLPDALENYATNALEVSLLGQASKGIVLFEAMSSASSRNSKALKSALDLAALLCASGFIPAGFHSTITLVEADGKNSGSPFLSKLLGSPAPKPLKSSSSESEKEPENIYLTLADSLIATYESLNSKYTPERLQECLLCAICACVAPPVLRDDITTTRLRCAGLNVTGRKLCKMFDAVLTLLLSPAVTASTAESTAGAIAKGIVTSLEEVLGSSPSPAEESSPSLAEDLATMLNMLSDRLGKCVSRRCNAPEEMERRRFGIKCLLGFVLPILKSRRIVGHPTLSSCFRDTLLPVIISSISAAGTLEVFELGISIVQHFCAFSGAYLRINKADTVFYDVYLRILSSSRCSDAQKNVTCQAIQSHLQVPHDILRMFMQRDPPGVQSLLENIVDTLCGLALPPTTSVNDKDKDTDCMGVWPPTLVDRIPSTPVTRLACRTTERVRREACLTLFTFLRTVSQWITPKGDVAEAPASGLVPYAAIFRKIRSLKDGYRYFLFLFNEKKKPQPALNYMMSLAEVKCTCIHLVEENTSTGDTSEPVCQCAARQEALILKESDGNIDRLVLGEYFAKCLRDDHIQCVFQEWIKTHDFTGLSIDEALRVFLGGFKLVGEAQVVDKTMELFSAHYCSQNAEAFPSADAAFILSFSMCMLNTDAHSPHIKNRMKLDEFIQNNRGIDNGKDIATEILEGIYERISHKEIVLRGNAATPNTRVVQQLLKCSEVDITGTMNALHTTVISVDAAETGPPWVDPRNLEPIWDAVAKKIMFLFAVCAGDALSTSEKPMDTSGSDPIGAYMGEPTNRQYFNYLRGGFMYTVRLCANFGMQGEIDWLMEQLYSFTKLGHAIAFKSDQVEIKVLLSPLRLELLSTTINLFRAYGNCFTARSWEVGYCLMSLLDAVANGLEGTWRRRARVLAGALQASAADSPDMWFGDVQNVPASIAPSSVAIRKATIMNIRSVPGATVDTWLEHLFDITRFNPIAQLRQLEGLLRCCTAELKQKRCFSLNKLLEFTTVCESTASTEQMFGLWRLTSDVFLMAGSMHPEISIPALDDFLVVMLGFLLRDAQQSGTSQEDLLSTLTVIFTRTPHAEAQRKVLSMIQDVTQRAAGVLNSGWKTLLSALSCSATVPHCHSSGWEVVSLIVQSHIERLGPYFPALVDCITQFAVGKHADERIALEAISLLTAAGRWLRFGFASSWEGFTAECVARWALESSPNQCSGTGVEAGGSREGNWKSLFEHILRGLDHFSPRVRAHTMASTWALYERHAPSLSPSLRGDVLRELMVPAVSRVIQSVPTSDPTVFDRIDYRILVHICLKGMLAAATSFEDEQLVMEVCDACTEVLCLNAVSLELINNEYVCVAIGVLHDALGACTTQFLAGDAALLSQMKPMGRWVAPPQSTGLERADRHPYLSRWVSEYKRTSPFDFSGSKRTEAWEELRHTSSASNLTLAFSPSIPSPTAAALRTIIRQCILCCLRDGILTTLQDSVLRLNGVEQQTMGQYLMTFRQTLLACCELSIRTGDADGLSVFYTILQSLRNRERTDDYKMPVQLLLLLPMIVAGTELAVICRPDLLTNENCGLLILQISECFVQELIETRAACMEGQRRAYLQQNRTDPDNRSFGRFPPLSAQVSQFYAFTSVFSVCTMDHGTTAEHNTTRLYQEWGYLLHVLGLKLLLALQPTAALLLCIPAEVQLDLISELPSVLEETVATTFLQRCWHALGLIGELPASFALVELVQLLKGVTRGTPGPDTPFLSREASPMATSHWDSDKAVMGYSSKTLLEEGPTGFDVSLSSGRMEAHTVRPSSVLLDGEGEGLHEKDSASPPSSIDDGQDTAQQRFVDLNASSWAGGRGYTTETIGLLTTLPPFLYLIITFVPLSNLFSTRTLNYLFIFYFYVFYCKAASAAELFLGLCYASSDTLSSSVRLTRYIRHLFFSNSITSKRTERTATAKTMTNKPGGASSSSPKQSSKAVPRVFTSASASPNGNRTTFLRVLDYGATAEQGTRRTMEDQHVMMKDGFPFFAVYDGHGGSQCAEFLRDHLHEMILNHPDLKKNPEKAIYDSIIEADRQFLQRTEVETNESGSVCAVALFADDTLVVGNVGDSEIVLCRNGSPVVLTTKHNLLNNSSEMERVKAVGGKIFHHRVGHPKFNPSVVSLGVTRAIGDAGFKLEEYTDGKPSGVIAVPEVKSTKLSPEDEFLVIGCDGLWDVMTYAEVVDFCYRRFKTGVAAQVIAEELAQAALNKGSTDNVTAMLEGGREGAWYVMEMLRPSGGYTLPPHRRQTDTLQIKTRRCGHPHSLTESLSETAKQQENNTLDAMQRRSHTMARWNRLRRRPPAALKTYHWLTPNHQEEKINKQHKHNPSTLFIRTTTAITSTFPFLRLYSSRCAGLTILKEELQDHSLHFVFGVFRCTIHYLSYTWQEVNECGSVVGLYAWTTFWRLASPHSSHPSPPCGLYSAEFNCKYRVIFNNKLRALFLFIPLLLEPEQRGKGQADTLVENIFSKDVREMEGEEPPDLRMDRGARSASRQATPPESLSKWRTPTIGSRPRNAAEAVPAADTPGDGRPSKPGAKRPGNPLIPEAGVLTSSCSTSLALPPLPVHAAVRAEQGLRRTMEDRHCIRPTDPVPFFAVYDGHGGSQCAEFLRDHLHEMILNHPDLKTNPEKAIYDSIIEADRQFIEAASKDTALSLAGAACAAALLAGDTLYTANVGDVEAGLYSPATPTGGPSAMRVLSRRHTATDDDERTRVVAAGGRLYQGRRVRHPRSLYMNLDITRSVGDAQFKLPSYGGETSGVVAVPSFSASVLSRTEPRPLLVLACDGLWSVLPPAAVQGLLDAALEAVGTPEDWDAVLGGLAEHLVRAALQHGSSDNITVVLARVKEAYNTHLSHAYTTMFYSRDEELAEFKEKTREQEPPARDGEIESTQDSQDK
eukprot:gene7278-5122_t